MTLPVRILAKLRLASGRFARGTARGTVRILLHLGTIGLCAKPTQDLLEWKRARLDSKCAYYYSLPFRTSV